MDRFAPGDVILYRLPFVDDSGRSKPTITDVKPMVVVEDSETLISLGSRPGHQPCCVNRWWRGNHDRGSQANGDWFEADGIAGTPYS